MGDGFAMFILRLSKGSQQDRQQFKTKITTCIAGRDPCIPRITKP
jgi:hypothetical protein